MSNLYPLSPSALSRRAKEAHLQQTARVVWLYGLSGAGKSTLALALDRQLLAEGRTTALLDGDNLRSGLSRGIGFSDADRAENLRRAAEVAKLFVHAGIIVICAFISPLQSHRRMVRDIIGDEDLLEVYLAASLATCERRDPKGLYAKAARGTLPLFTGKDSGFEAPAPSSSTLVLDTETSSVAASVAQLHNFVLPRILPP